MLWRLGFPAHGFRGHTGIGKFEEVGGSTDKGVDGVGEHREQGTLSAGHMGLRGEGKELCPVLQS